MKAFFSVIVALVFVAAQPLAFAGLKASSELAEKQLRIDARLTKQLARAPWSWEHAAPFTPHPIVFGADGTLKQSHGWTAKWEITGEHEVTVTLNGQHAVLHFNHDVTKFRGTDFDGRREIWGEIKEEGGSA